MFGDSSLNVSVPSELGTLLSSDTASPPTLPKWALEAILVEAVREGKISRGFFREALELPFQTAEDLLASKGVTYDITVDELMKDTLAVRRDSKH